MNRSFSNSFNDFSTSTPQKEIATPLCFRVTPSERIRIKDLAGNNRISDYLRKVALNGKAKTRRIHRNPNLDDKRLTRLLGALGQSRLSSNMNQIAKAVNMGALPVTDDLVAELHSACADIRAMRYDIITALGIKAEE